MRTRRQVSARAVLVATVVTSIGDASLANAQGAPTRKWEIEVHGGGFLSSDANAGTARLPGPGEPFTMAGIYGPPAPPVLVVSTSRRQSSWYFGDGPVLFNQAATALAANPVAMTAPFPGRIATLDPVLTRSLDRGWRGGGIGARISRSMTRRFAVEIGVDYSLARFDITAQNRDSIEATRASFIPAFNGLITSNPSRAVTSLTSTATIESGHAHGLLASGVREFDDGGTCHSVCGGRRRNALDHRRAPGRRIERQLPILERRLGSAVQ